jgi:uncharacterized protein (DUF4415 family)
MKSRKPVTASRKLARQRASAKVRPGSRRPTPEWSEFYRPIKKPVTLRLDADVLAWFQRQGRGYQTRINRALRKLMTEENKQSGS